MSNDHKTVTCDDTYLDMSGCCNLLPVSLDQWRDSHRHRLRGPDLCRCGTCCKFHLRTQPSNLTSLTTEPRLRGLQQRHFVTYTQHCSFFFHSCSCLDKPPCCKPGTPHSDPRPGSRCRRWLAQDRCRCGSWWSFLRRRPLSSRTSRTSRTRSRTL